MGISGFYDWIRKNYDSAIIKLHNKNMSYALFDHIYIDLNYLLHMFYNEKTLDDKITRLHDTILYICKTYIPTKTVNLVCDGVAPLAKLLLQRERRLAEARKSDKIELNSSSLNFTPGTTFIKTLDIKLNKLKNKLSKTYNVHVNILTKGSGEGEIKIKNLINQNIIDNPDSNHILLTNDGDVLLIVTATIRYQNIYILIKDELISINKIINLHANKYGTSKYPQFDFAFLNLLNGNDYFSKLKYINTSKLWDSYKSKLYKYPDGLINVNNNNLIINKDFLIKILESIICKIDYKILKKTHINDFNEKYLSNYLAGLTWCINMYYKGDYLSNNYMDTNYTPDPLMLLLFLYNNSYNLQVNISGGFTIPEDLCSILLLPEKAINLMDNNKYIDFISNHSELYEEERCQMCKKYHKDLGDLQKEYSKKDCASLNKQIKNTITSKQKEYTKHNKTHFKINLEYIKKIVNNYNKYINE